MKLKLLPLLLLAVFTVMQVLSVEAQNDAFFMNKETIDRSVSSSFVFNNFNSDDNLTFSNFEIYDSPIGNGLLLLGGFAVAFKLLKRKND